MRFFTRFCILILFQISSCYLFANDSAKISVNLPPIILKGIPAEIEITADRNDTSYLIPLKIGVENHLVSVDFGKGYFKYTFQEKQEIVSEYMEQDVPVNPIPLWLSIFPPMIAILMALFFKEVITSLFTGLAVGTSIIYIYSTGSIIGIFNGLFAIVDTYVLESLTDSGHVSIIVFSMMIGAMVNIITKNGGMKGVVNKLTKYAKTPRSAQFITWLLGLAIFFDDYANTLVVGNTMRPVTDKLNVSRQKLAYIVDSTAAPVAAIAFVTTWIGAELSYIQSGISTLGISISPYTVFLNSLAYSFYPIFTLIFIFMLIYRNADFGPMYKIEKQTRKEGVKVDESKVGFSNQLNELEVREDIKARWYNAAIPVFIVIFGTFAGLLYTGWDVNVKNDITLTFGQKLSTIIGNSDSYKALLWSSLIATIVAVLISLVQKLLTLQESIDSIINGFRTMLTAVVILILAWAIALVTEHLHTADFIAQVIVESSLSPIFVPLITFILAALVAFSTGSSWGTMAILYPLVLPASWLITKEYNYEYAHSLNIFYNVVASVLAGSVLGDHCSPISDTTILSSLASSCPHIEHVRTQMPYALTVGGVAAFVGVLPAAIGVPWWITFPAGIGVMFLIIKYIGKKH
ncbi:MAG: Na+/H+ antiporter NhaC family protein [Salinivirgaceae bacterium]|nr:Na+/H+ antiporter NhaC family protein [Salinivirgaceae bacterium]